jgi:hypothetical protein
VLVDKSDSTSDHRSKSPVDFVGANLLIDVFGCAQKANEAKGSR